MNNNAAELIQLRSTNASRQPDWRWRRAVLLESKSVKSRSFNDKWISRTRQFIRMQRSKKSEEDIFIADPVLYEVHNIYNETGPTRWTLEALIMADTDPKEICDRFGYDKKTGKAIIEAYEATKFDVRSRLKHIDFVRTKVIGSTTDGDIPPTEESILKVLGWLSGRKGAGTLLLDGYLHLDELNDRAKRWYYDFINNHLTRKTVRSILKYNPVHSPEMLEVIRTLNETRKVEQELKLQQGDIDRQQLGSSQTHLLQAIQFTLADFNRLPASSVETQVLDDTDPLLLEAEVSEVVKDKKAQDTQNNKDDDSE